MKNVIQFGAFELKPDTGELRKNGIRIKLQGKAFQILQALLECPGEVVTREELKNRLWPGDTFVDFESGLNTAANRLRLTLCDSAENPRYIETVARTGYRFIGAIADVAAPPAPPLVPKLEAGQPHGAWRYWRIAWPIAAVLALAAVWINRPRTASPAFQQISFRRGMISGARFAPDGQTILYSARWDESGSQLFLANSVSPESRALDFRQARLAGISPTSELALLSADPGSRYRGATLSRVPLNGGAPLTIATGINGAEWGPDAKTLAVYRIKYNESVIEYPIGKAIFRTAGTVSDLRISPKEDALAFIEHPLREDDGGLVRIIERGGAARTLSSDWASAGGLAWAPSGREIWFTAGRTGLRNALYAVTLDGKLRQIATLPDTLTLYDVSKNGRVLLGVDRSRMMVSGSIGGQPERDLSWFDWSHAVSMSPNGKLLLFDETGEGGRANHSVYLRNLQTKSTVRLGDGQALALSPDLQWAVAVNRKKPAELSLLPAGPEAPRVLSGHGLQYNWAQYFPDGQRLLVIGSYPGKPLRLYVQQASGGDPVPVGGDVYLNRAMVSPDGARIAGLNTSRKIAILPLAGGEPQTLPIPFAAVPVSWSMDGKALLVQDLDCWLPARILRVELATSEVRLWKEIAPTDPVGLAYFLNFVVSRDEQSYAYSYLRVLSELFVVDGWS